MVQKTRYEDDDDRVIADMNVEGTPWHDKAANFVDRQAREAARKKTVQEYNERMSAADARRYTFYALLAGLALTAALGIIWALLTLFMTQVWFR